MARGGYGSGSGVPLRERVRDTNTNPSPDQAIDCPARHCWVLVPVDGHSRRPGLLLEWRRTQEGEWEGRVVYVAAARPGSWATVEEWLSSAYISPPG